MGWDLNKDLDDLFGRGNLLPQMVTVTSDADCTLFCDGKRLMELTRGVPGTVQVNKGKHHFVFTAEGGCEIDRTIDVGDTPESISVTGLEVLVRTRMEKLEAKKKAKGDKRVKADEKTSDIVCPYCFHKFSRKKAQYQCTNNEEKYTQRSSRSNNTDDGDYSLAEMTFNEEEGQQESDRIRVCPKDQDEKYNNHWHFGIKEINHIFSHKGFFGGPPKSAKCDRCGAESSRFVCPNCHNWLPTDMIIYGSRIISVIGAQSSGKTTYITSLYHELRKYGYRMRLTISPKDESPRNDYRTTVKIQRLQTRLFDSLQQLDKTPVDENPVPLIFELTQSKDINRPSKNDKHIYLVFYDTAGESFENQEEILRTATYLQESSAVILLLDPFSVRALRRDILGAGYDEGDLKSDPARVVSSLLSYAKSDSKRISKLRNKPIAVTFSKIDAVVKGLESTGNNYSIHGLDLERNSSILKTGVFDMTDTDQISEGLIEICRERWELGGLVSDIFTTFGNTHFFGVSSLGGDIQTLDKIRPYRVLDPLIWILSQIRGFDIPIQ